MRKISVLLWASIVAISTAAAEDKLSQKLHFPADIPLKKQLEIPQGTSLKPTKITKDQGSGELYARLIGQIWISGTFIGFWPGPDEEAYGDGSKPVYWIIPDSASKEVLPRFISHPQVEKISIENGERTLRLAVQKQAVDNFLRHKIKEVKATGRFLATSYEVGVECDAQWARAKIDKVVLPDQLAILHLDFPYGC